MSRQKQKKFRETFERHNVLEPGKPLYETIKGKWNEVQFNNNFPITLELACGRGEYSVGMARMFKDRNFIGIDIKGDRIWKGSGIALDENIENVAFLRTDISFLEKFFEKDEVDEIWITFPDPRPKLRDAKRRLTSPRYLELYKKVINKNGFVKFKTDNTDLFEYTLEVLSERTDIVNLEHTFDVYNSELAPETYGIKTRYEAIFTTESNTIKYLKFKFV